MIPFRITGLSPDPFAALFGMDDAALAERRAKRFTVDENPGYPDRIGMRDLDLGERAILVNHTYQPANTPYRASHAIFVLEGATEAYDRTNEIPEVMRVRQLSLRAFDRDDMMIDADLVEGTRLEPLIQRFFENPDVRYIHVHNAKRGCYSGRVDRA